jgi:Zn-dependent protease with chaperone function
VSGRKQLVLIPESQEITLGVQAYQQVLAEEPLSQDPALVALVERVGQRIAAAAGKPEYDWEFKVIAKDVRNAFALPGGKVAVYEGILPICQDEAGLAVVMSHEVAHALARHGGERLSQQGVVSGVGGVIQAVGQRKASEANRQKLMEVYGVATKYGVILPYSRKHESEADAIGLILMAKAGYDPGAAPEFWERFSASSGSKPPEWLSTHPADARRAADLRAMLPEAMKYYNLASRQYGLGDVIPLADRTQGPTVPLIEVHEPHLHPTSFAASSEVSPPAAPAATSIPPDSPAFARVTDESTTPRFELVPSTDGPGKVSSPAAAQPASQRTLAAEAVVFLPAIPAGEGVPVSLDAHPVTLLPTQPLADGWKPVSRLR